MFRTTREQMQYNQKMTDRWSMSYFFVAWTLAGLVLYKVSWRYTLSSSRDLYHKTFRD